MGAGERWGVIERVGPWHGQTLPAPHVQADPPAAAADPAGQATDSETEQVAQPGSTGSAPATGRQPGTEAEQAIAAIWTRLLDAEVATVDSDFFDLGGQSLVVLRLAADLEAAFGLPVQMADLFTHTTVAAQAELVEELYERLLAEVLAAPATVNAARAA